MLQFYYLVTLMKVPSFLLRFAAFFLILVFSQKSGAGLIFHNLLHEGNFTSNHQDQQHHTSKELGFSCTCIDDFLAPFKGSQETIHNQPVSNRIIAGTFINARIVFNTSALSFLRGPPECMA